MNNYAKCFEFLGIENIGSKMDFVLQDAQTYAQENGLFYLETSAKTATNVNEVFYEIGKRFITLLPCNQAPVV